MAPAPIRSLGRGARRRILDTARRLFSECGINATGIAEVVAESRVSRRTLYQQFASKDELVVAYLRDLAADPDALPQRVLDREELTARARLLEVFQALGEEPHPLRGDPFLNAAVELPEPAHPAHRLAAAQHQGFAQRLGELAREAGARDAESVGRRLALLYAGAAGQTLVSDRSDAAQLGRAMAAQILDEAIS